MKIQDLRLLAVENNACSQGIAYLDKYIKKHPNATATDFFKSKRRCKYTHTCFSISGYLRWIYYKLIDWTHESVFEKTIELFKDCFISHVSNKDLADVLAETFKDA